MRAVRVLRLAVSSARLRAAMGRRGLRLAQKSKRRHQIIIPEANILVLISVILDARLQRNERILNVL